MSDDVPPPSPPAPDPVPPPAPSPPPGTGSDSAPAFGSGKLSASDDKLYCILAQFISFIIWPWKKDESPSVDVWGKEGLNFFLTAFGAQVVLLLITCIPFLGQVIACVIVPVAMVIGAGSVVLAIIAALKASEGKLYRYPINLRLIK